MLRLAVIGAGRMARVRTRALLATGRFDLCGVAARRRETAQMLADSFGTADAFDDYRALTATQPDAVLVEVPHDVQDGAVAWAIDRGCHVLVGGPLATTKAAAIALRDAADARGLIVEAGFEARYKPVWETARDWVRDGRLGTPIAGTAVALWPADPASWYYDEARSGGMPLTHMTYCFLNPLRWLFGEPEIIGARANRLVETAKDRVAEETCVVLARFRSGPLFTLTAGYVRAADAGAWQVTLFGSRACLDILPDESGPGRLRLHRGPDTAEHVFAAGEDGFARQAAVFAEAVAGRENACRNSPAACLGDLVAVEAIRARTAGVRI